MYTESITILETNRFRVTSHGNGAAYTVERKSDAASFFLQDDSASDFRTCWEHVESRHPRGFDFGKFLSDLEYSELFEVHP